MSHLGSRTRAWIFTGAAILGCAIGWTVLVVGFSNGFLHFPGDDLTAYLAAGARLAAGHALYGDAVGVGFAFLYSPPWAVAAMLLQPVPAVLLQVALTLAETAALRALAGSWRAAAITCIYPFTVVELVSGNINLLIAAAIVLAWRGNGAALAWAGLAKVAPFLAFSRRTWRSFLLGAAVAILVTLPWLDRWGEWASFLLTQRPVHFGMVIAIPWQVRVPIALVLVATRRSWLVALAVMVAMPAIWFASFLILLSSYRLAVDDKVRLVPAGVRSRSVD